MGVQWEHVIVVSERGADKGGAMGWARGGGGGSVGACDFSQWRGGNKGGGCYGMGFNRGM